MWAAQEHIVDHPRNLEPITRKPSCNHAVQPRSLIKIESGGTLCRPHKVNGWP